MPNRSDGRYRKSVTGDHAFLCRTRAAEGHGREGRYWYAEAEESHNDVALWSSLPVKKGFQTIPLSEISNDHASEQWFDRWARREDISDVALCNTAAEVVAGRCDADLVATYSRNV